MYSVDFDYYRASTVAEATRLLAQHAGAKLMAGGHSLIPLLKLRLSRPPAVIDIGGVAELKGISVRGGTARIGPLTTHAELASSQVLADSCPIIAEAAGMIGDPQVRNRGTIGGNVVHADPASDLPAVLTALGARFTVTGPRGPRTLSAGEMFRGVLATAVGDNEVLTSIEAPVRRAGQGMAYVKFPHPASRYAVVGVAAVVEAQNGRCKSASIAVGGLVPKPTRAPSVEKALSGKNITAESIRGAAEAIERDLGDEVLGDIFASADYRRAMAKVYVSRALSLSAERAR